MSRARLASVALGLALALPLVASAQAPAGPTVGASATYRWTSALTQPVSVIVGQRGAGGQVTWSVTEERAAPGPVFVTYSVARGDRRSYTLQILTHEAPDGRPLSITQVTVDRRSGKALRSVIQRPKGVARTHESGLRPMREAAVTPGTREEIIVPAGRFAVVRGKVGDAEVWVSDQVPALGLVRAVWPSGTLELVGSAASGAKDLLPAGTK